MTHGKDFKYSCLLSPDKSSSPLEDPVRKKRDFNQNNVYDVLHYGSKMFIALKKILIAC